MKLQFIYKFLDISVNMQRMVLKTVKITQVKHNDKFVDVQVAMYSQVLTNSNRAESRGRATCSIL